MGEPHLVHLDVKVAVGLFVVKTHASHSARPAATLAARAFARVRALRLVRNPFDAVLRGLYGDPARFAPDLAPVGENATRPPLARRLAEIAKRATYHARFQAFWAAYAADGLAVRYETLALATPRAAAAMVDWVGAPADRGRLAAALAAEVTPAPERQIGKESVRLRSRVWKDGSPYFDAAAFAAVEAATGAALRADGYERLARAFERSLDAPAGRDPDVADLLDDRDGVV